MKRQYCGDWQRANCQAGVFVGYVSSQGYTVLDRRLYVPTAWLTDAAYAERRRQCGLPAETTFKTKPELAQEMLAAVVHSQVLRCRWVVADEAFGGNPGFLDGVAGLGLWYFTEVPHTTRVWQERRPPTSRRGVGATIARSGSAWWRALQRRGRCWKWQGRCPLRRGHARLSKKAAKDP